GAIDLQPRRFQSLRLGLLGDFIECRPAKIKASGHQKQPPDPHAPVQCPPNKEAAVSSGFRETGFEGADDLPHDPLFLFYFYFLALSATAAAARFSMMSSTIFFASSGFSSSAFLAASRPWPINAPSNCSHAPFLSTAPHSIPTSRMLPSLSMPW